jgi:hypothetical protein
MRHNWDDWLNEVDAQGNPEPGDLDPAAAAPDAGAAPTPPAEDPNVANQDQTAAAGQPEDISGDPQAPDMPEEKPEEQDFEVWKSTYLKESVKGDSDRLIELLQTVRDRDGLHPYQKKFVEDNWNIQMLRQHSNIDRATRQIRGQIRNQLDRNNPATSVLTHMTSVLETIPLLNNVFIKLNGYGGLKGDLHRKFIAALLGAVQVGSGSDKEDLIYNEREYSIQISTRFNSRWGDVMIGSWSLKEDDAERYLSEPEMKRLQEGSPHERDALRRRIVVESIADLFETRAFIINVAGEDGTIFALGWDVAGSLRTAFTQGKLVVKTRTSENSEAMITDDGDIVPLVDISIDYMKETGGQTDDGEPESEGIPFLERRDGVLFLTAPLKLIREASSALQGAVFKEIPYNGNPSDLKILSRCVYSAHDLLMRQC